MNGCVIPGTPIAVDMWKIRLHPCVKLFFLSHMHGDHIVGLTASWKENIYCSHVSGRLLRQRIKVKECYIKTLELNTSHLLPLDETGRETMTVTLIDANHCPGAVMFLFQGYFGNILYTGDMRYDASMFTEPSALYHLTTPIDVLYLDNTYNDPQCVFSTREEAATEILQIIQSHPEHDILLGMKNLGKEDLFVQVAKQLNEWIVVGEETYNDFKLLELPNVFTTDHKLGRIQIVKSFQITTKTIDSLNAEQPTIGIIPTALYTGTKLNPYTNCDNIFIVNYSDHSSYTELHEFVSRVKPRSIIPVVKCTRGVFNADWTARGDMFCFNKYLDQTPQVSFEIPFSVKNFMNMNTGHIDQSGSVAHSKKNKSLMKRYRLQRAQSFPRTRRAKGIVFPESPVNNEPPARVHIIFDNDDDIAQAGPTSVEDSLTKFNKAYVIDSPTLNEHTVQETLVNTTTCRDKLSNGLNTNNSEHSYIKDKSRYRNHQVESREDVEKHQKSKRRKLPLTLTQSLARRCSRGSYSTQNVTLDRWLQSGKEETNVSTKPSHSPKARQEKITGESISPTETTNRIEFKTNKLILMSFKDGTEKHYSKVSPNIKSIVSSRKDGSIRLVGFGVKSSKSLKCKPINMTTKNTKMICKSKLSSGLNCKPLKTKSKKIN